MVDDYQKTEQSTRQKDMQQRETDSLAKLVADGKITEAQKQLIIAEMTALKAKYNPENSKSLTDEQRKTQMQAERDELAAWAKANNIDEKYLMFGRGFSGGERGGRWENKPSAMPTVTK